MSPSSLLRLAVSPLFDVVGWIVRSQINIICYWVFFRNMCMNIFKAYRFIQSRHSICCLMWSVWVNNVCKKDIIEILDILWCVSMWLNFMQAMMVPYRFKSFFCYTNILGSSVLIWTIYITKSCFTHNYYVI